MAAGGGEGRACEYKEGGRWRERRSENERERGREGGGGETPGDKSR